MHTHRTLRAHDIQVAKRKGWCVLRGRSSRSVRVYYPELNREQVIARLTDHLPAQELPLRRVVLFGSYARGNYAASSDVDVLVVYEGRPRVVYTGP